MDNWAKSIALYIIHLRYIISLFARDLHRAGLVAYAVEAWAAKKQPNSHTKCLASARRSKPEPWESSYALSFTVRYSPPQCTGAPDANMPEDFKSYKGHHTLLFGDSYFTSIIGPNGSGKSNS